MAKKTTTPMENAKDAWGKIVEWAKEMWEWIKEAVEWACEWIADTLRTWYSLTSAWIAGLSSKVGEKTDEEVSQLQEKKITKLKDAWKSWKWILKWTKKTWKWVYNTTKWALKWVWNTLLWWYHLLDAWDKKIWEKIEESMDKKWKDTTWKIWHFVRTNIAKILLWTSLLTYWWVKTGELINQDKHEDATELVIDENENQNIKSTVERDMQYAEQWVELLRDWPLTFYVVKEWEWLTVIRQKLSQIPEFSYLSDPEYAIPSSWRNIKSFNTPNSSLVPGFYLPIPMKAEDREIGLSEFKESAKNALKQMKNDKTYWEKVKWLLNEVSEDDVIDIMAAYARSETAQDWSQFSDDIWSVELHRWEPAYRAYSFSYFHILMWKWPWMKARKNLGLTEWDCYDAKNACKLFLWYCCEKKPWNPAYFFEIKDLESAKIIWKTYNWQSSYGNKLRANVTYCKNN